MREVKNWNQGDNVKFVLTVIRNHSKTFSNKTTLAKSTHDTNLND